MANLEQLVAHSVATYALSLEGFPERVGIRAASNAPLSKYRGPQLIM